MKAMSKRESALRSEGEELRGLGKSAHRNRIKKRTDKARRQHGKKIVRGAMAHQT